MRQRVDLQLLDEVRRFELRATCESCVHFAELTRGCAQGYPNHEHLHRKLAEGEEVVFCKEFELC
jgi:hypothetical protein